MIPVLSVLLGLFLGQLPQIWENLPWGWIAPATIFLILCLLIYLISLGFKYYLAKKYSIALLFCFLQDGIFAFVGYVISQIEWLII